MATRSSRGSKDSSRRSNEDPTIERNYQDLAHEVVDTVKDVGSAVMQAPGAALTALAEAPANLVNIAKYAIEEGAANADNANSSQPRDSYDHAFSSARSETPWIDATDITMTAKKAGVLMQKSALASSDTLVERETLKKVIEDNHRRFTGCLMLPVTLLFFIFYAGAARMHEDITMTHLMESPVKDLFAPVLEEDESPTNDVLQGIVTVDDLWHFMQTVFVPNMFKDTDATGIALPEKKRGRFFMYNNLVGAVIIEQQRSVVKACEEDTASHMMCYDQMEKSRAPFGRDWVNMPSVNGMSAYDYYRNPTNPIIKCDDEGFVAYGNDVGVCAGTDTQKYGGRRLELLRDEIGGKMAPSSSENADMFKFYLFQGETADAIGKRVQYLKDRGFVDHQTTEVGVKALYINNDLDIPRVDSVRIIFHISRGGGIYVTLRMEAIFLKTFSRAMAYFFDFLFGAMLVASTVYISFELCYACRKRMIKFHFTTVNCVTWLTCFMGWFNALGLLVLSNYRIDVKEKLQAVWTDNTPSNAAALQDSADNFVYYATWYRVFVADAHIIFMMRCFIALQWQPRLAVVTHTLIETSVDLFHFLIVFVPTFMAFAIAGNEMFGRRVQQFATIEGAICVCFKIAMESEFDWMTYSEEDFLTAMSWVWLYVLLVVLLMLNMVLAIIMDVYSVIRLRAGNSETVWANIMFLCNRAWMAKKWVKDSVLQERVAHMPRTISQDELIKAIPELSDYQLARLMNHCIAEAQAVMRMGVHASYTAQMTAATKIGLDGISRDISVLKDKGWMGRGVEAGSLPERMLAQDVLQSAAVQTHWMTLMQTQIDNLKKKTHGKVPFVNLTVTFYTANGLPAVRSEHGVFATCHVFPGDKDNFVKSDTRQASATVEFNQELVLERFKVDCGDKVQGGLQFNVYEDSPTPGLMVAAKLQRARFFPDGYEGPVAFPGGSIIVKVEVQNPDQETTV